jgi:hypothetical protein
MTTFRMKVADHPIELRFPRDTMLDALSERYHDFVTTDDPETVFHIHFPPAFSGIINAGEPQATFAGERIIYRRNDLEAETDDGMRDVQLNMRDVVITMDAALRIFYSILLIRRGGLLLHAASTGLHGEGLLFIGKTESGKSELSSIAHGDHLTDELSPVRPTSDGFAVYGSPFWGLFAKGGVNVGLPVRAAFFLFRSDQTRIETASRAELLRVLLRCVLNFSKEPAVADRVVRTGISFVSSIPGAKLLSPPSPELWTHVERFVADHS